jgi:hypothetical protein
MSLIPAWNSNPKTMSGEGYSIGGDNSRRDRVSFYDNPCLAGPAYNSYQEKSQPDRLFSNHEQVVQDNTASDSRGSDDDHQHKKYPPHGAGGYESEGF